MRAIKWLMSSAQYHPKFGRLHPGDIVHFNGDEDGREAVAAAWVNQGAAEWVEEKEAKKPTKGRAIKEANNAVD
jgi:hypothetical protein